MPRLNRSIGLAAAQADRTQRLALWVIALLTACLMGLSPQVDADDALHDPWDALLQRYVVQDADGLDRFDYPRLAATPGDRQQLQDYIAALEATPVSGLARPDQFVFWANLYNAVTVRLIIDEQPSRSIRQIRPYVLSIGPWGVDRVTVEGRPLSLDAIEHDILRVQWDEPRIHYAVNCASVGCPNLGRRAWRAATLDADLTRAARAFVNSDRGVVVTPSGVEVSRIYKWFREDFGDSEAGVIAHLRTYAEPDLAAALDARPTITGHHYDWGLNTTGPFAGAP